MVLARHRRVTEIFLSGAYRGAVGEGADSGRNGDPARARFGGKGRGARDVRLLLPARFRRRPRPASARARTRAERREYVARDWPGEAAPGTRRGIDRAPARSGRARSVE